MVAVCATITSAKYNVDVALGVYRNYISGYISKAFDAMNFSASEHFKAKVDDAWLVVYRLMCKRVFCIPEISCMLLVARIWCGQFV